MKARTLCIIPARGGSKRIPRKNMRNLAGKPLLAYTVEAAQESDLFHDIVVSSDDEEVLAFAQSKGVLADRRPEALCGDLVDSYDVVTEYLEREQVRGRYDHVAKLLPTCPFRRPEDLRGAYELYLGRSGRRFVVAVTEYDFPVEFALDRFGEGPQVRMRRPDVYARTVTSQLLGKSYHPNGAVYLAPVEHFLIEKTFFAEPLLGYVMSPERSLDIDYPHQFHLAELLMRENLGLLR